MYRTPMADRDAAIVRAIESGTPQYVLAARYGVSRQWVSAIWRRHLAGFKDETAPERYWRDLGLSARAAHCLVNDGIYTIDCLRQWDMVMLARAPSVGAKTMTEYYELLAREETRP
jgi:hypothetical protein